MKYFLTFLALACGLTAFSQPADTIIYKVTEELPRFPGCETLDTTIIVKNQCAQTSLLVFFNRNIAYPDQARQDSVEGSVVLSFVVEKDGFISNLKVLKDIGGGCAEEVMRVAGGMNEALKSAGATWVPGKMAGKAVRTQVTVPIRFKLQDPPDFVMVGYDSVFVTVDDSLQFNGGSEAMKQFIQSKIKYPAAFRDSCKIGAMDMTLLVNPDNSVKVLDVSDYWSLGVDFQFEAIQAGTSAFGKWTPAKRKGRAVPSSVDVTVTFIPPGQCTQKLADYEKANRLSEEGSVLFNEGSQDAGIAKLNEALALFPGNANFLYLRGQAYMNMKRMTEACADFRKVQSIVTIDMVNQLIPLICN